MLAASRRARIIELVRDERSIQTDELSRLLGVSVETVRRDLEQLERAGSLTRVRGGAVASPSTAGYEPPFGARVNLSSRQKEHIGAIASRLVEGAHTVFIDLGTTAAALAHALPSGFSGTVITPSVRIAELLVDRQHVSVLVPGGQLRSGDLSMSGPAARAFLADVYPDVAFIGTGGVDLHAGVTDFELAEVELKRVVVDNARRSFALADSTKLGTRAPYRVCDLERFDGVVTDDDVTASTRERYTDHGITLLTD